MRWSSPERSSSTWASMRCPMAALWAMSILHPCVKLPGRSHLYRAVSDRSPMSCCSSNACRQRGNWRARKRILNIAKSPWPFANFDDKDSIAVFHERSEEHTSELQSHSDLVCRLLLEKKKTE